MAQYYKHDARPSPTVPFFLVAATVAMAFLPWLTSYVSVVLNALHQVNDNVFLWPLLIIFGISFISAYHDWVNPTRGPGTVYAQSRNHRDWRGGGDYVLGSHHHYSHDNSGVGLFILLVLALILIFWR